MKTLAIPPITEAEFQRQVLDLARLFRWTVAHFRPAQTSRGWRTPVAADGKGFPDLVLVRQYVPDFRNGDGPKRNRLIFAELKTEKAKATDEQEWWLDLLRRTCAEVYLWRPSDIDRIAEVLR